MSLEDTTRRRWEKAFNQALELDGWGQVEEAIEAYQRLLAQVQDEQSDKRLSITEVQRGDLSKLAFVLHRRIKELTGGQESEVKLGEMKKLKPYFAAFLINEVPFPLGLPSSGEMEQIGNVHAVKEIRAKITGDDVAAVSGGSLLPAPVAVRSGDITLTLVLNKWGFKDAANLIDPFITVSLVDKDGLLVEAAQDTPISTKREPQYITFTGVEVFLQTPLNLLPDGCAVFLEFKHYKPKKKKISTKAYCYLEFDEIKQGTAALESYRKPTEFKRRKSPQLLSVKPLYLHLDLILNHIA